MTMKETGFVFKESSNVCLMTIICVSCFLYIFFSFGYPECQLKWMLLTRECYVRVVAGVVHPLSQSCV